MNKRITAQFSKYILTGLMAFVSEYSVFRGVLLIQSKFVANAAGMMVGFWISFLLNRIWSFQSKERIGGQLLRYSILFAINLCISSGLLYLASDVGSIPASIAKLGTMCMIILWNFIIYKKIIYSR